MAPQCSPNRYIVAIAALLVVMAISVAVAVIFPYQDEVAVGAGQGVDDASAISEGDAAAPEIATPPELQIDAAADIEPAESQPQHSSLFDHEKSAADNAAASSPVEVSTTKEEGRGASCVSLLKQSDADSSDMLEATELVAFLQKLQKANLLGEVDIGDRYPDLPFSVKILYSHLACKCPASNANCCAETEGIYLGKGVEEEFLKEACQNIMAVEWRDITLPEREGA